MKFNRRFQNALMLPTGDVLIVGGNSSGLKFNDSGWIAAAESWNPATNSWTELADMSVPRTYHSVALLLPDGRVYSGGGGLAGNPNVDHDDAQIFTPPYLYNSNGTLATRPVINNAPGKVDPGEKVTVNASNGITKFSLIKMTATTHGLSTDLRFLNVPFTAQGGGNYELTNERQ